MRIILVAILTLLATGCTPTLDSEQIARVCGVDECCAKSLKTINDNGYQVATDNLCQEGKKLNQLSCPGSLRWCE